MSDYRSGGLNLFDDPRGRSSDPRGRSSVRTQNEEHDRPVISLARYRNPTPYVLTSGTDIFLYPVRFIDGIWKKEDKKWNITQRPQVYFNICTVTMQVTMQEFCGRHASNYAHLIAQKDNKSEFILKYRSSEFENSLRSERKVNIGLRFKICDQWYVIGEHRNFIRTMASISGIGVPPRSGTVYDLVWNKFKVDRATASAPMLRRNVCERASSVGPRLRMSDENRQMEHEKFVEYCKQIPKMKTCLLPEPEKRNLPTRSTPLPTRRTQSVPVRVLKCVASLPSGLWQCCRRSVSTTRDAGSSLISTTVGAITSASSALSQGLSTQETPVTPENNSTRHRSISTTEKKEEHVSSQSQRQEKERSVSKKERNHKKRTRAQSLIKNINEPSSSSSPQELQKEVNTVIPRDGLISSTRGRTLQRGESSPITPHATSVPLNRPDEEPKGLKTDIINPAKHGKLPASPIPSQDSKSNDKISHENEEASIHRSTTEPGNKDSAKSAEECKLNDQMPRAISAPDDDSKDVLQLNNNLESVAKSSTMPSQDDGISQVNIDNGSDVTVDETNDSIDIVVPIVTGLLSTDVPGTEVQTTDTSLESFVRSRPEQESVLTDEALSVEELNKLQDNTTGVRAPVNEADVLTNIEDMHEALQELPSRHCDPSEEIAEDESCKDASEEVEQNKSCKDTSNEIAEDESSKDASEETKQDESFVAVSDEIVPATEEIAEYESREDASEEVQQDESEVNEQDKPSKDGSEEIEEDELSKSASEEIVHASELNEQDKSSKDGSEEITKDESCKSLSRKVIDLCESSDEESEVIEQDELLKEASEEIEQDELSKDSVQEIQNDSEDVSSQGAHEVNNLEETDQGTDQETLETVLDKDVEWMNVLNEDDNHDSTDVPGMDSVNHLSTDNADETKRHGRKRSLSSKKSSGARKRSKAVLRSSESRSEESPKLSRKRSRSHSVERSLSPVHTAANVQDDPVTPKTKSRKESKSRPVACESPDQSEPSGDLTPQPVSRKRSKSLDRDFAIPPKCVEESDNPVTPQGDVKTRSVHGKRLPSPCRIRGRSEPALRVSRPNSSELIVKESPVWTGKKAMTSKGLVKDDYIERDGHVVNKHKSEKARCNPWIQAVMEARNHLGITGFHPIRGKKSVKGNALYMKAQEFYRRKKLETAHGLQEPSSSSTSRPRLERPQPVLIGKDEPKASSKGKAQPKASAKGKAQSKASAKGKAKSKASAKGKAKPKAVIKGKAKPKAVIKAKGKAKPKAVTKTQPKSMAQRGRPTKRGRKPLKEMKSKTTLTSKNEGTDSKRTLKRKRSFKRSKSQKSLKKKKKDEQR